MWVLRALAADAYGSHVGLLRSEMRWNSVDLFLPFSCPSHLESREATDPIKALHRVRSILIPSRSGKKIVESSEKETGDMIVLGCTQ